MLGIIDVCVIGWKNYAIINDLKRIPTSVLECFISKIIVCPDHLEWHLRTGTEITKDDDKTEPIKLAEFKINREFAINFLSQNSGAHHFKFSCWKDEKIEIYI